MNEKQELVIRTLSYLEEHLQEPVSLQTVAQHMQYSPYYVHRSFTQLCGMRMHDYLKRRRISEAARCLCETDASVLEIAVSYGYESSQAFSKAFKQLYKMTCTQFRKEQRYYALQHPLQLHELNRTESAMRELQVQHATPKDLDTWMKLMRQAVDFFPFLEEAAYEQQLLDCMKQKEAFLVSFDKTVFAAIQLQLQSGQIDVLAIHPQLRSPDVMEQLVEWMLGVPVPHIPIWRLPASALPIEPIPDIADFCWKPVLYAEKSWWSLVIRYSGCITGEHRMRENTLGATRTLPQAASLCGSFHRYDAGDGICTITDTLVSRLVNHRCTFRNQYRLSHDQSDHWFILDAGKRRRWAVLCRDMGAGLEKGSAKCRSALKAPRYDWNRLCPCSCSFAVP
ncbi:MAG: helix-turn-helix transcriptional regulator [[Clostridium] innocuum]